MELNELISERVEWRPVLKQEGKPDTELEFHFRPFSIEDESWLKRIYPGTRLQEVFEKLETTEIAKIAFHQLEVDSKRRMMEIKFIDIDEEGKEFEFATTGPEKVGVMVRGISEIIKLIDNILKTRGLSLPLLEKIVDQVGIDGLTKLAHGKK